MSKKVMLALVPAGGGHQSLARAISEALLELEPDVTVSAVNLCSAECGTFPLAAVPRLYAVVTINLPPVWRALFHATSGRRRYALIERVIEPFVGPRLKAVLHSNRPDVIVSLNPVLGSLMQRAVQELGWRTPVGVVISDLVTMHEAWFCRGAAWHAVPTEEARQACLAAGIAPETIHVTGQPVGPAFCRSAVGREGLRRTLGLPVVGSVVLIMGGGEGVGQVEGAVAALLASGLPCHLVVVAGRNEPLRQRLAQRNGTSNCQVLGYVTNMADWMQAADVLVTKAGPNTVMEAVHCGLPMVVTGAIPGQEEANLPFVISNGLGIVATRPGEIVAAVGELLTNEARSAELKRAMARMRRPEAAQEVARLILA